MYLHIPNNLPHKLAGKYLQIHHAIYGLQESNRLFSLEMTRVILSAGFVSCPSEPQQFILCDSVDPGLKCIASVTVDDVLIVTNHIPFRSLLLAALAHRFGPLTINLESKMHTGIEMTRFANGAIRLTQDAAIARAASLIGVSTLPPVPVPANLDTFFLPSFVGPESQVVSPTAYSSVTGSLVHFLKTRSDVHLLVSYLCSYNHAPLEGHFRRALHVLRYLASTPGVGPVFHSTSLDLAVYSDSAYGVFRTGYSSSAHLFCIGLTMLLSLLLQSLSMTSQPAP